MGSYGEVTASQIASTMPVETEMQDAATGNGAGTSMECTGYATAVLNITASVPMSGGTTINFEGSVDDTTWVALLGAQVGSTNTGTSTTAPGDWMFNVAGYKSVRARISAYSAGTIDVKGYVTVLAGGSSGGGATGAVTQSGPWSVMVLDSAGTNKASISSGGAVKVDGSAVTQPVSGTFWQTTQPVSVASLPLPSGAATAAKQPALGVAGTASTDVITVQGVAAMTPLLTDGSGSVQPISASSLPLPTGASTAAKQPAFGTAGTAATDVLSVQGIASMTPLLVDGSGVVQPISASALPLPTGAATAAKQPALGTAGTASSDVITVQGIASMTALKVDGSAVTQPISASALPLPAGASTAAKQPALGTAGTASSDVITVQGIASMTALKVDGSAVTQPVSASALPLPSGASTAAKQPSLGTAGSASGDVITVQGIASMTPLQVDASVSTLTVTVPGLELAQASTTSGQVGPLIQAAVTTSAPSYTNSKTSPLSLTTAGALRTDSSATTQPVSGTFWQATQPVSAAALPLPSGAATSAKQPALGTAGSASSDVITVQGIASMTPLKVDVSGATLTATIPALELAQNSTTSGQVGPIIQGAVSTSAPSYTNGKTSPLSLTTTGALRVDVGGTTFTATIPALELAQNSTTSGQVGPIIQAAVSTSAPSYTNGKTSPLSLTPTGALRVDVSSGTASTVSITPESTKNTYMACTGSFSLASTPTDVLVIQGSSTKTVRILQIRIACSNTSTSAIQRWYLIKRNTSGASYSGGTSSNATNVPLDSNSAAATAVIKHYTANATTLATSVGTVDSRWIATLSAANQYGDGDQLLFNYMLTGMPITLRGTSEYFAVNFNGATPSGSNTPSFSVLWTEE